MSQKGAKRNKRRRQSIARWENSRLHDGQSRPSQQQQSARAWRPPSPRPLLTARA